MDLSQRYKIERIITEIVMANKDKSLNELKRIVKQQVRMEVGTKVASEVEFEEIVEVITKNKLLRTDKQEKRIVKTGRRTTEIKEEMER